MSVSSQPAFTPERRRTLHAVVGRILPGSLGWGAAETDAAAGCERALLHPFCSGLRQGIEGVLDRLESQARQLHGNELSACSPDEQDGLLQGLEREPNPWTRFLFRSLIGFSLEGLLGDPVHGGNKDFLGWKAMGLRTDDVRSGFCRGARGD